MSLKSSHIKAARALADWSQEDLARHAEVAIATIRNIESGKTETASTRTYGSIERAFMRENIFFLNDGVERKRAWIKEFSGENYFLNAMDDMYISLIDTKNPEILFFDSDDRKNSPEITQRLRKLHNGGIKTRDIIETGNTYLLGPTANYRWIPSKFYRGTLKAIYANKVFLDFNGNGLLIQNPDIAAVERNQFNMIWELLPELKVESTADERL